MINKVILMGRLTADPELRQTQSGISMCRFNIAINRPFTPKDGGERQTDFIGITTWRNTAEFVSRYFSKGKMIIVEGSLRTSNYTDNNGVKHYSMDVQAENVSFGESKNASQGNPNITTNDYYQPPQQQYQQPSQYQQQQYQQPQQYQQQPPPPPQQYQQPQQITIGNLEDFEEILSDGEVPF